MAEPTSSSSGQSLFQKTLSGNGGTPPLPLRESPLSFSGFFFLKGPNYVFLLDKVKSGLKRPYNRPKRAKMYEK